MEEVGMSGVVSEKKVVDERELKGMDESCCIDLSDDVISRKMSWHDRLVDGGDVGKKRKSDDCFSGDEKVCIEECEEKVITEDLGSSSSTRRERERCLFPVDEREQGSNNRSVDWKGISLSEERGVGFPNLELALGGETKPMPMQQRMVPPFLVDKNDIEDGGNDDDDDDDDDEEEEEEVREGDLSASLSLSLSFSMAGKHKHKHMIRVRQKGRE